MSLETYTPLSRDPGAGDIFTIHDVAAYLKLPVSTAYRLAELRRLPGARSAVIGASTTGRWKTGFADS